MMMMNQLKRLRSASEQLREHEVTEVIPEGHGLGSNG